MKDPIGIGIVGVGAIGMRGALSHLCLPDVEERVRVRAVADTYPGRAEAAARAYGVPVWYDNYEALLADSAVDAVSICTPIALHFDQGLAAIRAGKHVHFNKTMAITVEQADRLIDEAAQRGLQIVASPGQMLHPHNRRIRRAILEGAIGRPVWAIAGIAIKSYHLDEEFRTGDDVLTNVDPSWYFRLPGGGPQYDVTVYCLHTLTGILGPAKRVAALSGQVFLERGFHGTTIPCDMDDTTFMLLDFGNTLFGVAYGTVAGSITEGFQPNIYGTRGQIVGTRVCDQEMRDPDVHQPHVTGDHIAMKESHVFEDLMQLVDSVQYGAGSIANAEHARHVIDIIECGYRAAETGQTQELRTAFQPLGLDEL